MYGDNLWKMIVLSGRKRAKEEGRQMVWNILARSRKNPLVLSESGFRMLPKRSNVGRSTYGGTGIRWFCMRGKLIRRSFLSSLTTAKLS